MWQAFIVSVGVLAVGLVFTCGKICTLEQSREELTRDLSRVTELLKQEQARSKAIEQSVVRLQESAVRRAAELREYERDVLLSENPLVNQCIPDELLRGLRSWNPESGGKSSARVPAHASGDTKVH